MKKVFLIMLFFAISLYSQDSLKLKQDLAIRKVQSETDTTKLKELLNYFKSTHNKQKEEVIKWAIKNKQPLIKTFRDGTVVELQAIDKNGNPIYRSTYNVISAKTISTNKVQQGGTSGLNLTGSAIDIGIWDGGLVNGSHNSLYPQVEIKETETSDIKDHPTHVAGTMIANAVDANAKGMAPNAKVFSYNYNNDIAEMAEAAMSIPGAQRPLMLSNHSYGEPAGWKKVGSDWVWYGENEISIDNNFGKYDDFAYNLDQIVNNAPYYTIVWAAGNFRGDGPEQYTSHKHANSPNIVFTDLHYKNGGDSGFDCIPHEGLAKNIITVGAVDDIPNGYQTKTDVAQLNSSYSSWGPTDDGRIKPDVVANGDGLYSTVYHQDKDETKPTGNNYYYPSSGTSMATPSVTGSSALLQEHYKNKHNQNYPKAATLKALIIHSADEAGSNPGPDFSFGWGLMNTNKAAEIISSDVNYPTTIDEYSLANGQTYSLDVVPIGNEPLKVTIAWIDPPYSSPTNPVLVNDLDLRIAKGSLTYLPWKLDWQNPSVAATKADNTKDNVEQIIIDNPVAGEIYTIKVSCKNSLAWLKIFQ